MKYKIQERYASHPNDVKNYGTAQHRDEFLIWSHVEENHVKKIFGHIEIDNQTLSPKPQTRKSNILFFLNNP